MADQKSAANDWLRPYWMPFTPNRAFKDAPRLYQSAEGFYYQTTEGSKILDAFSGLWCSNLGHCHPKIVEAIQQQAATLDYSTSFNIGHPKAYEFAKVLADQFPDGLDYVFFTNSGSESADTALKMALAYHRLRGEGTRTRFIGRERGYHGVGFGGISVGGMVNNRKFFGALLPGIDHMTFPYDPAAQAFTRGEAEIDITPYTRELEKIIALHDPSTIAAVIVEPFAGSAGVYIPPKSYLAALREITRKYGILLIFDEVITAFGRLGEANAVTRYGVQPDIVTIAKGMNNGTVPMGGVIADRDIYATFMEASAPGVEFFHGFTYSAHPLAVAAGLATQDVFRSEGVYERARNLIPYFEDAVHSLKGEPHVNDIRNIGLACGMTIATRDGNPAARASEVYAKTFANGVGVRSNGDTLAIAPILTMERAHIDMIIDAVRAALRATD